MRITFADRCAWRCVYVHNEAGQLVARLGVDPNDGVKPRLLVGIPLFRRRFQKAPNGTRWACRGCRIPLPYVRWKSLMSERPVRRFFWRISQWFWHGLDGRYGWGHRAK